MYAAFLLLPHLSHLCCLHINLREAKREIVTTLLSLLSRSPCYPRVRLLAAEQKPPQDFPRYFQPMARSCPRAYFTHSPQPHCRDLWRGCSAPAPPQQQPHTGTVLFLLWCAVGNALISYKNTRCC